MTQGLHMCRYVEPLLRQEAPLDSQTPTPNVLVSETEERVVLRSEHVDLMSGPLQGQFTQVGQTLTQIHHLAIGSFGFYRIRLPDLPFHSPKIHRGPSYLTSRHCAQLTGSICVPL